MAMEGIAGVRQALFGTAGQAQGLEAGRGLGAGDAAAEIRKTLAEMRANSLEGVQGLEGIRQDLPLERSPATEAPSFGSLLERLVDTVDDKQKTAKTEAMDLMMGRSDNLHQTMIAMQESSVAFSLLVETRNKVVEGYQELMRMQV